LQAPRPLVAADFAAMVLSTIAENATGVVVGRATSIDGYYPDGRVLSTGGAGSTIVSCTTVNASPTVTFPVTGGNQVPRIGATVTGTGVPTATFTATTVLASNQLTAVSSFASVGVGTLVAGTGIPAGASITAINTGASSATLSVPATAAGTGVTLTPTQTVAAIPPPTEATFTLSANATTSATNNLTFSSLSGYGPVHLTCVGTTTNASATIAVVTPPWPGAIADVGARVRGTGIPAGATVLAAPAPSVSSFTISANATSSNTGETITVSSWTTVQLADTTFVTDANGLALSAANMDALLTWLQGFRPQNWLVNLTAPSYSTIYVTFEVHVLAAYSPAAVLANCIAAVESYLSPASWGNPGTSSTGSTAWLNSGSGFNIVRYNKLLGIIESVPGVDYVPPGSAGLAIGFTASPSGTSDLTMPGPAPLPLSSGTTILGSTV
jgi:hypothetical protein